MNRTFISPFRGMKFNWVTDDYRFMWMKNTLIPLDILWLDKNHTIIELKQIISINNKTIIQPKYKSRYVIELPYGSSIKYNIKPGDSFKRLSYLLQQ